MSKKEDACNIVYLAGKVKLDPKVDETVVRALIELPGMKNAVPVGVHKDKDGLADKLACFRQGDFIQVVCMLEPYGVKQSDGSWKNGLGVKITAIKTEPKRQPQRSNVPDGYGSDDDRPF